MKKLLSHTWILYPPIYRGDSEEFPLKNIGSVDMEASWTSVHSIHKLSIVVLGILSTLPKAMLALLSLIFHREEAGKNKATSLEDLSSGE